MKNALRSHWPEYLMESGGIALFMVAACVAASLLWHPMSPLGSWIGNELGRRVVGGVVMGSTSVAIITSPWGRRSGGHFNPAITLTYFLLGKVRGVDAVFYLLAQFAGGAAGVGVASLLVGPPLAHAAVNYAATVPGHAGMGRAFAAELLISMLLMSVVLLVSNHPRLGRYTPFAAGLLVALFIIFEQPLSGMSMNPARTLGSAVGAWQWTALWVYFVAPPLGMMLAGLLYRFRYGQSSVLCAKLDHAGSEECIFNCGRNKSKQIWISERSGDKI